MMMISTAAWMMRSHHRSSIGTIPIVVYEGKICIEVMIDRLNIISIDDHASGEILFQSMMMKMISTLANHSHCISYITSYHIVS